MGDHTLHYGEAEDGTEFLLTTWHTDDTHQLAVRSPGMGTWGPPVELQAQPLEPTC